MAKTNKILVIVTNVPEYEKVGYRTGLWLGELTHYTKAQTPFETHVVEDGLLITGQNPGSAQAVGVAVVKRLQNS